MRLALALAVVLGACQSAPPSVPTPFPSRDPSILAVTVLLDLSGDSSPIGSLQRRAMEAAERQLATRRKVTYVDVAGDEAKLILALKRADDAGADAVVIGSRVAFSELVARAVAAAAVPVLVTLPIADPAAGPAGRWAFALAPTPAGIADTVVADASARLALDSSVIVAERPDPTPEVRALLDALRRRSAPIAQVTASGGDGGRVVRAAITTSKAVFFAGPTRTFVDPIGDASASATALLYLSYLTTRADLIALSGRGLIVSWAGSVNIAGRPTDSVAATAADAFGLLGAAFASTGSSSTPERLRDAVERLTFSGVVTRYSFTPDRHAGFDAADLAALRWSGSSAYVPMPPTRER